MGFSPHPPVSVSGTDILATPNEVFLGGMGSTTVLFHRSGIGRTHLSGIAALRICLEHPPTGLNGHIQQTARLPFPVTPKVLTRPKWCRNINLPSIAYAFRPRLRFRLTLRGLALLRNPWVFGDAVSRYVYRYSCQHKLFRYLQTSFRLSFNGLRNAPLPRVRSLAGPHTSIASATHLSPVTF